MDGDNESVKPEPVGRRTRSGRTTVPVTKATTTPSKSPVQSKSSGRKTRKKMVLVEVEVSDEEETEYQKTESGANAKSDDTACEASSDESKEITLNSNNVTENEVEDAEESNDVRETNEELEMKDLINEKTEIDDLFEINEMSTVNEVTAEENIAQENETIEVSDDESNLKEETIRSKDTSVNLEVNKNEEMDTNEGNAINDDCIIITENDGLFSGTETSSNGLNVIVNDDIHFDKVDICETLPSNDQNEQNGMDDLDLCQSSVNDSDNEKHESVKTMEIHRRDRADDNEPQNQEHADKNETEDRENVSDKIQSEDLGNVTGKNKMEMYIEDEDVIMKDDYIEDDAVMKESGIKEKDASAEDGEIKDTNESSDPMVNKLQPADPDAENISEDELPSIQVAKVPETEEVSDEELPGPKRAELPADTEVVSEDELPAVKKEGTKRKLAEGDYDPGSPTSENEVSSKKPFLDPDVEKEKEKPEKPKKLPELDKYWKAVNDDPTDFTGWTYLLQYVDQENDMEAAREAYDAFLSHYPYCYGYWRKYADYEKRKGNKKKCEEVFERGLKAIPLSVDLWIHYLTYVRTTKPEDEEFIRSQFERALSACGLEFRSDRLWDSYIKWESDGKRFQQATSIYDKLLATPTQGYTTHFENFQEHVTSNPPNKIVEVDEFLALRKEVKHMLKHDVTTEPADNPNVPPGEDSEEVSSDEETKAIRERIVSIRRKIHKNTVTSVTSRWNFEEGIKRPYFHVKPLERCQLKNWQEYLDYEIEQGDKTRIIVLFERCLIACALYEEFWLRFVHYLESLKDPELHPKIKDVYERACTIHHIKKPNLHLQWAMFEESIKNYTKGAEILVNLEKSVPNLLQVAYRRINLERRREDYDKCSQLFEHYIMNSKNKVISTNLAIKYARFCLKIMSNIEKSFEVLNTALTKDPNNPRLYLQLIDLTMQKDGVSEKEVSEYIDAFLEKENIDVEQKILFAQRKLEFLDDFGSDIQSVQKAYEEYQKLIKIGKENKKKDVVKGDSVGKKEKNPPLPSSQASSYSNYANYSNSSGTPYQYSGSQQGQYNYSQYGQSDQYQYGSWQYPQGNYSGYNQWSGYSGGYGY